MTSNARSKRRRRQKARDNDTNYTRAQRTSPWRSSGPVDDGSASIGRPMLTREQLEEYLNQAERAYGQDGDPWLQQAGYANASSLYADLALHTDDPTWRHTAKLASELLAIFAARIRWEHGIPTIHPQTEAYRLGLGYCRHCGRAWNAADTTAPCESCPQLLYGPTPSSAKDAERFGPGEPVDLERVLNALARDRERSQARSRARDRDDDRDPADGQESRDAVVSDSEAETLGKAIVDHHLETQRVPFEDTVDTVVRRHVGELSVQVVTAAIIHARRELSAHGVMTWTTEDGAPGVPVGGGDEETRAHDARTAAAVVAALENERR